MIADNVRRPTTQRVLCAIVVVLGLATWFSVSAVVPALEKEWSISAGQAVWLTASTQLGFVVGAVVSAATNLADRVDAPVLLAIGTAGAAVAIASFAIFSHGLLTALPLRAIGGVFLAAVYPVGMKLMASWSPGAVRGRALGLLIGALTLGSAMPHLLGTLVLPWRLLVGIAAVMTLMATVISLTLLRTGPYVSNGPRRFEPGFIRWLLHARKPLLINAGYLGHMWELYALWTWAPVFAAAAVKDDGIAPGVLSLGIFAAVGIAGGIGCLAGGWAADRFGRPVAALVALATSGACCLLSPVAFASPPPILFALALVWGAAVIADSGPFSTMLSEAVDTAYVGTALTVQTAAGFVLTVLTIQAVPLVAAVTGWQWAFVGLSIGPILGVVAIVRFRVISTKEVSAI